MAQIIRNVKNNAPPKNTHTQFVLIFPWVQPLKLAMKGDHFGLRPVLTAPNSDFDTVCYHQKACIPASKQVMTHKDKSYHADVFKLLEERNHILTSIYK